MTPVRNATLKFAAKALPAMLATLFALPAHSAFYVEDDAPQLAALARATSIQRTETVSIPIPQLDKTPWKTIAAAQLSAALPAALRASTIQISAFPKKRNQGLAKDRTAFVRSWYVANGVPSSVVVINNELDTPDADDTIQVAITPGNSAPSTQMIAAPAPARPIQKTTIFAATPIGISDSTAPAAVAAGQAGSDLFSDQVKLAFASRLIGLWKNKTLKADDVLTLMSDIIKRQEGAPSSLAQSNASGQQAQQATIQRAVVGPAVVSPVANVMNTLQRIEDAAEPARNWELMPGRSLKDNMDSWALAAGWQAPVWTVQTPYQVAFSKVFTGTFMQALTELNKEVPELDFHISKAARKLRVSEAQH